MAKLIKFLKEQNGICQGFAWLSLLCKCMCSFCSLELILPVWNEALLNNQLTGTGFEEAGKRTALVMREPKMSEGPKRALRRSNDWDVFTARVQGNIAPSVDLIVTRVLKKRTADTSHQVQSPDVLVSLFLCLQELSFRVLAFSWVLGVQPAA